MSIFDDDKSSMDKMQSSFKNLVFEIIYYLISGENFPLILYVLFVAIETIQFFYFAFSDEVLPNDICSSWACGKCHHGLKHSSHSSATL